MATNHGNEYPKIKMTITTIVRITYPLFCWGIFAFYGLAALEMELLLQVLIVALALAGLAQTFWQTQFQGNRSKSKSDLALFMIGVLPAVIYPCMVAWHFAVLN